MSELYDIITKVAKSESLHPWRDIVDIERDRINREIRDKITKELNMPPTPRDEEIKDILAQEKEKYELDKAEFEANPLHWSNNKRRMHGLPALRGKSNKYRSTKFHSFSPTPRMFFAIEDIIERTLEDSLNNGEFFKDFVDVKDLSLGDKQFFHV